MLSRKAQARRGRARHLALARQPRALREPVPVRALLLAQRGRQAQQEPGALEAGGVSAPAAGPRRAAAACRRLQWVTRGGASPRVAFREGVACRPARLQEPLQQLLRGLWHGRPRHCQPVLCAHGAPELSTGQCLCTLSSPKATCGTVATCGSGRVCLRHTLVHSALL
jgi:hypothetical protein